MLVLQDCRMKVALSPDEKVWLYKRMKGDESPEVMRYGKEVEMCWGDEMKRVRSSRYGYAGDRMR